MEKPRHEDRIGPYKSSVATRTQRNPELKSLYALLQTDSVDQRSCRIVCLEFSSASGPPNRQSLDLDGLASILGAKATGRDDLCGRLLIVEDLSSDIVETLGCLLNIDPFFFASHIDTFQIDIARRRPSMATFPSKMRTQNFLNLHYHRVVELKNPESTHTLLRDMNVPRIVRILPKLKGTNIGLVRHCCSILKAETKDGLWLGKRGLINQWDYETQNLYFIGLILVDAPISNSYVLQSRDNDSTAPFTLQTELFQGGFQDFLSEPSFSDNIDHKSGPIPSSPLESFIYYWSLRQPPGFNVDCPTLFSLSYYALRIDAAEWMTYLELMYHCIQQYEYSPDAIILASIGHIEALTADIHSLQRWGRRSIATARKIRYAVDFLKYSMIKNEDKEFSALIRQDYEQIALDLDAYSRRLEVIVSVDTSLVQAIDCRRSLIETMNISRLTYLALIFLPLTFVSGLFSMNDKFAPGCKIFGLYFAISIPLCILVFLIAHPPTDIPAVLSAWVWRSRMIPKCEVWVDLRVERIGNHVRERLYCYMRWA